MRRITVKNLRTLCGYLNDLTGQPSEPWSEDENGRMKANVGNYHISQAYGGYCLHQMMNEGGGVTCPIQHGHGPARELFEKMHAFMAGIRTERGD
jgi:hypothetical protein